MRVVSFCLLRLKEMIREEEKETFTKERHKKNTKGNDIHAVKACGETITLPSDSRDLHTK
jgi:hypothetical protein